MIGERIRGNNLANLKFDKEIAALLVMDPYNDFISEGGKVWDRLKGVAEANKCVPHMMQVLDAARKADIRIFYALHRRDRPGDPECRYEVCPNTLKVVAKNRSIIVPYFNRRFTDEDFYCRGNGSDRSSADRGIACQRTHSGCSDPFSRKSSSFSGTRHRTCDRR